MNFLSLAALFGLWLASSNRIASKKAKAVKYFLHINYKIKKQGETLIIYKKQVLTW